MLQALEGALLVLLPSLVFVLWLVWRAH